jgi:anti-anti-sigma regulatory factor
VGLRARGLKKGVFQMQSLQAIETGSASVYRLPAVIDENVDFNSMLGLIGRAIVIDCGAVMRINSRAIHNWARFAEVARKRGYELRFRECAPVVVEAINLVHSLARPDELESIRVPFHCEPCGKTWETTLFLDHPLLRHLGMETSLCPCCLKSVQIDHDPIEYFRCIFKFEPQVVGQQSWAG